jgi:hypothetical protein
MDTFGCVLDRPRVQSVSQIVRANALVSLRFAGHATEQPRRAQRWSLAPVLAGTAVRVTPDRDRVDEWATVLAAGGIPHRLRSRLDGCALIVAGP